MATSVAELITKLGELPKHWTVSASNVEAWDPHGFRYAIVSTDDMRVIHLTKHAGGWRQSDERPG